MERSPELEAITRRAWRTYVSGDEDSMRGMFTSDPNARVILAAAHEWMSGSDVSHRLTLRSQVIGEMSVEILELEAFEQGNAGWSATKVLVHRPDGQAISFRSTVTFALEGGQWRIVQMHTSAPVGNMQTFGFDISASLSELVESLGEGEDEHLASVAGPGGTVTMMFTDIEDSTVLSREAGDREWAGRVHEHFEAVRSIVEAAGGSVVKTLGDGTMSAFTGARQAATAAVDVQQSSDEAGLRVRIGLHTGDAIGMDGDYFGVAVAKAARVASAAEGRQILASSVTRELVAGHGFVIGERMSAELKGLEGVHDLYPVVWES